MMVFLMIGGAIVKLVKGDEPAFALRAMAKLVKGDEPAFALRAMAGKKKRNHPQSSWFRF